MRGGDTLGDNKAEGVEPPCSPLRMPWPVLVSPHCWELPGQGFIIILALQQYVSSFNDDRISRLEIRPWTKFIIIRKPHYTGEEKGPAAERYICHVARRQR